MGAEYHRLCRACGYEPGELSEGEIHRLAADRIACLQDLVQYGRHKEKSDRLLWFSVGAIVTGALVLIEHLATKG